jgi:hypothetical protein
MKNTSLADALGGLRDENPKRLVSLVRTAWPDIKAAIDRGHSVKVIHDRFVGAGIRISYRLFAMYVGQLRRESWENKLPILEPLEREVSPARCLEERLPLSENGLALISVPRRRLFSARAAARYLGIDERTLKRITDCGGVPARRMGARRVYALDDLDSYIASLPRVPRAS